MKNTTIEITSAVDYYNYSYIKNYIFAERWMKERFEKYSNDLKDTKKEFPFICELRGSWTCFDELNVLLNELNVLLNEYIGPCQGKCNGILSFTDKVHYCDEAKMYNFNNEDSELYFEKLEEVLGFSVALKRMSTSNIDMPIHEHVGVWKNATSWKTDYDYGFVCYAFKTKELLDKLYALLIANDVLKPLKNTL